MPEKYEIIEKEEGGVHCLYVQTLVGSDRVWDTLPDAPTEEERVVGAIRDANAAGKKQVHFDITLSPRAVGILKEKGYRLRYRVGDGMTVSW